MYKEIINKIKPSLERTLEKYKEEINSLRTGRATPALLESIEVECYGSRMPLKQLAAIQSPEPRLLTVHPWDKNSIKEIEKAIAGRAGLSVAVTGDYIRVTLPPLDEESRKELVKVLHQKIEQARISIRLLREQAWKEIQDKERAGEIREDDKFRGKDELQKMIDDFNGKVEKLGEAKEKEIMTV